MDHTQAFRPGRRFLFGLMFPSHHPRCRLELPTALLVGFGFPLQYQRYLLMGFCASRPCTAVNNQPATAVTFACSCKHLKAFGTGGRCLVAGSVNCGFNDLFSCARGGVIGFEGLLHRTSQHTALKVSALALDSQESHIVQFFWVGAVGGAGCSSGREREASEQAARSE